MVKNKQIKLSWTKPEKLDIHVLVTFECYWQNFISGGDTGHYTMYPPNFKILSIFSN